MKSVLAVPFFLSCIALYLRKNHDPCSTLSCRSYQSKIVFFARLACQQAEQSEHVQQVQAFRESAVFHLHGAVLAFLQELVYYRLNDTAPTLKSIEELMAVKGQISPEVAVMQQLAKSGFVQILEQFIF